MPMLPPGRIVELPGRGTTFARAIEVDAAAPTLLLLHGWTATADLNWWACYGPLAARFNVVAIDHRGHGRGIRDDRPFTLEDAADDAAALVHELGLRSVVAVGYSMGGPVATLLWQRHRALVDGLVLCATSAYFRQRRCEQLLGLAAWGVSNVCRSVPARVVQSVAHRVVAHAHDGDHDHDLAGHDWRRIVEAGDALLRHDARPWVGSIDVPSACVVGLADLVVPPDRQHELGRSIPGCRTYVVPRGHDMCAVMPSTFARTLVRACTDVAARIPATAAVTTTPTRRLTVAA
jgi:3-oxoadipate enol-lactonase